MTTTQEWRTMPAGKGLDAFVAERVMGHVVEWFGGFAFCRDLLGPDTPTDIVAAAIGARADVPDYSSDIADAWQVVQHMANDHVLLMLEQVSSDVYDMDDVSAAHDRLVARVHEWTACFQDVVTRGFEGGETAPLAIVRAALAATEAPTDG